MKPFETLVIERKKELIQNNLDDMPKHFIIADTHFYHQNIIEYSQRPFQSVAEMNDALVKNWNSVVGPEDIVYHLGDFAFGNRTNFVDIVHKLNGHIIFIKGNHDRLPNAVYEREGLTVCRYGVFNTHIIGFVNGTEPISATHRPIPDYHDKMTNWLFYGHVHNKPCFLDKQEKAVCISVERINYTPFCLEDFFASQGITDVKFIDRSIEFK